MLELIYYGIINSVSLMLMSVGFALAYGVSRIPNFAHGALFILAGYLAWVFLHKLALPYPLAVIFALGITALLGALLYRFILIRVRGMPISEIIAAFGVGLAILELLRWAGLRGMTYMLPSFIDGSTVILGIATDYQRICILVGGPIILCLLWVFTNFTKSGLALKAIAQNERAALTLGIDSDKAAMLAVSLGALLAGMAAVLILPLGSIVVEMGYEVLIFAIAVSVCGGLGSWKGALAASFLIGFGQILTVNYIAPHYHFVVAMFLIILVLILKPSGLFGSQKELEERV